MTHRKKQQMMTFIGDCHHCHEPFSYNSRRRATRRFCSAECKLLHREEATQREEERIANYPMQPLQVRENTAYTLRLDEATAMLTNGCSEAEIRRKHGLIVWREAVELVAMRRLFLEKCRERFGVAA